MDPAVLRQRDLLIRAGVDVEDAEDDHELLVLPDRHIERLVGDRDRQHDGILAQTGGGPFRHRDLRRLQGRRAEAEDRIGAVALSALAWSLNWNTKLTTSLYVAVPICEPFDSR